MARHSYITRCGRLRDRRGVRRGPLAIANLAYLANLCRRPIINMAPALAILARESDPSEPERWRSLANGARLDIPLPTVAAMEAAGFVERLRCDGELVMAADRRGHVRLTSAGWAEIAKR